MSGTITMTGEEYDALREENERLKQDLAYFPPTVRALLENIEEQRAELAELKAPAVAGDELVRLDRQCRNDVAAALGLVRDCNFAWSYLLSQISEIVKLSDGEAHITRPAQTEQQGYPHESMDAIALARYHVGPSGPGTLHRYAVRAGDGECELYRGSKSDCEHVARKLAGAFLNGGLTAIELYAAPIAQTPADGLVEALRDARELIAQSNCDTGVCCCGSPVDAHGFGDGHSPVDEGGYRQLGTLKRIDALLDAHRAGGAGNA